ncbi:MAG: RNA polymerase sigma factor [Bacteroidaceae bacterium]|nr:RNA polymerase sigma factor [Bacteroidaceae bacterium]
MKDPEDILWVTRVLLLNDQRAYSSLMNKYLPHIQRFFIIQTKGNQAVSDDLTQETFIKAWQGLSSFKQISSFRNWLLKIAFYTFVSYMRENKKEELFESIDDDIGTYEIMDDEAPRPESEDALHRAIYRLNLKERQCVTLFYLEEKKIKEIAKITGYSEGSIKVYLSRGRNNLEKILIKE